MSKANQADGEMSIAEFLREIDAISSTRRRYDNFSNFIEAAYCALAKRTALDEVRANALEARYMAVVELYGEEKHQAMTKIAQLFGRLVLTLASYEGDFLGSAFMEGEFRERDRGQYFTPYSVARMMALINFNKDFIDGALAEGKVLTVAEPAAGTGVMIIATAAVIRELGVDPTQVMLGTLTELDPLCMKMAFLQMAILDIPAVCVLGDSLSLNEIERAYTLAALRQPRNPVGESDQSSERRSASPESRADAEPLSGKRRDEIVNQPDLFDL